MALLTRLAASSTGAELLLETGLMLRLAEMTVFSARPESRPGDDGPMARYQQILFPSLRLCHALLSSLGSSNRYFSIQRCKLAEKLYIDLTVLFREKASHVSAPNIRSNCFFPCGSLPKVVYVCCKFGFIICITELYNLK